MATKQELVSELRSLGFNATGNISTVEYQKILDGIPVGVRQALKTAQTNRTVPPAEILSQLTKSTSDRIVNDINAGIKKQEGIDLSTLSKLQASEIDALTKQKASSAVISAEKAANAAELAAVKEAQKTAGYQDAVTRNDAGYVTSTRTFTNDAVGARVGEILDKGYGLLDDLNLSQQYMEGKSTIGDSAYVLGLLSESRDPTTGNFVMTNELRATDASPRYSQNVVKYYNAVEDEKANPTLSKDAKVIDIAFDDAGNRYEILSDTITTGVKGGISGAFARNANGDVQYLGASTSLTPTGGSFWSRWGGLILGIGTGFLLGPIAGAIGKATGLGAGASGALAGAGLGAGTAALTGGDILTGALTGGIGGAGAGVVGKSGGLGSSLATNGLDLSVDTIGLLNNIVPGISVGTAPITDLSTSLLDDATIASANAAINAGAAAGLLDDATVATAKNTLNQVNPNVQTNIPGTGFTADAVPITPGGYGLTSPIPGVSEAIQDVFSGVSFANADEVAQAAQTAANISGDAITLIGPGGIPITRAPTPLEVVIVGAGDDLAPPAVVTNPPVVTPTPPGFVPLVPPAAGPGTDFIPGNGFTADDVPTTPRPGGNAPIDDVSKPAADNVPITPRPGGNAPIDDVSQPASATQEPSIGQTVSNLVDIAQETLPAIAIGGAVIDALAPAPAPAGDTYRTPSWVTDPAESAVLNRIIEAQAAMPAPMQNLFNAQFQRGGFGAGQFIGYDLLNRTGDIPLETLLGVSPIATGREALLPIRRDENGITRLPYVPNLSGINYGQAPTSATSLI